METMSWSMAVCENQKLEHERRLETRFSSVRKY